MGHTCSCPVFLTPLNASTIHPDVKAQNLGMVPDAFFSLTLLFSPSPSLISSTVTALSSKTTIVLSWNCGVTCELIFPPVILHSSAECSPQNGGMALHCSEPLPASSPLVSPLLSPDVSLGTLQVPGHIFSPHTSLYILTLNSASFSTTSRDLVTGLWSAFNEHWLNK